VTTLVPAAAPPQWGEPAPLFRAPTPGNPSFYFASLSGRYVLLAFMPPPGALRDLAFRHIHRVRSRFDDTNMVVFPVLRDAESIAQARDQPPGLRFFLDHDSAVSCLYGALGPDGEARPMWVLLDPTLRVLRVRPIAEAAEMFREIAALGPPDDHAGVPLHAPVLVVPRVLERGVCKQLIDYYDAQGGVVSGVMREIDGKTVGVVDDFKRRRDAAITDQGLRDMLRARLGRRLLPEIERAFAFKATRLERYIVACYDAQDGGYFRPHRDNTTKGTAHRVFAVTVNLNAEDFEGGGLRFPEFGQRTYRAPTGGAVVFSCSLLHEATPVTQGRRYAFLPFLYDDARAEIRKQNVDNIVNPAAPETV
jgi:predicted 2-oxoglutarate/Fe(II)-dependent dioxygenase YbiX